jgi:hypothetical protein
MNICITIGKEDLKPASRIAIERLTKLCHAVSIDFRYDSDFHWQSEHEDVPNSISNGNPPAVEFPKWEPTASTDGNSDVTTTFYNHA